MLLQLRLRSYQQVFPSPQIRPKSNSIRFSDYRLGVPDFLNEAQLQLQRRAHALGQRLAALGADPDYPEQSRAEIRSLSKDADIFSLTQPRDYGGLEGSSTDLTIAREALGQWNVGHLPGIFGPSPGLLSQASTELKERLLGRFLSGEITGGFGFTEPSDAKRHTWAAPDGEDLIVNGAKSYVTGGSNADFINTLVELEDVGPAMILIETDRPGVSIDRQFGSLDGSHHASFVFTDVRVPRTHLIGAAGAGLSRALEQVNSVRMAIAADCVGLCGFICDLIANHIKKSEGKGRNSDAIRIQFGRMRARTFAARSTIYRTARLIDAGENSVNEVMASKILATETAADLVDSAIQIVGGEALVESHPLATIFRRVRATRLAEGPTDLLHSNISRGYLDLDVGRI